jgi:hypothetical protein
MAMTINYAPDSADPEFPDRVLIPQDKMASWTRAVTWLYNALARTFSFGQVPDIQDGPRADVTCAGGVPVHSLGSAVASLV